MLELPSNAFERKYRALVCTGQEHRPISPRISPYLPVSPRISPYLPISRA